LINGSIDLPLSGELLMTASTPQPAPAKPLHEKDVKDVSADCGPMPQQDMSDAHGHDMHQQKLVQLVGCHDDHADAGRRLARAAIARR
jgi:hypothetical protein